MTKDTNLLRDQMLHGKGLYRFSAGTFREFR